MLQRLYFFPFWSFSVVHVVKGWVKWFLINPADLYSTTFLKNRLHVSCSLLFISTYCVICEISEIISTYYAWKVSYNTSLITIINLFPKNHPALLPRSLIQHSVDDGLLLSFPRSFVLIPLKLLEGDIQAAWPKAARDLELCPIQRRGEKRHYYAE